MLRIGVVRFSILLCVFGELGCTARPARQPQSHALTAVPAQHALGLPSPSDPRAPLATRVDGALPSEPSELPRGTVLLHVGSSSAGAMGPELTRLLEQHGVKSVLKFKQSTYVPQWAGSRMGLARYIAKYDPDVVIVSLGGNETEIPDPSVRIDAIHRLVKVIGDRPCVWIGTPRWKVLRHTGILEVLKAHASPCKFIDTDELAPNMQTLKDGIHPTVPERRRWARRVFEWLKFNRDPKGKHVWSFKARTQIPPQDVASAEDEAAQ